MGAVSQLVSVEQDPCILIPKSIQIKRASQFFHGAKTAISWALPKFNLKPQPDPNRPTHHHLAATSLPPRCHLAATSLLPRHHLAILAPHPRRGAARCGLRLSPWVHPHAPRRARPTPLPNPLTPALRSPPTAPRRHLGREPSAAAYVLAHGFNPRHRALRLTCAILRLLAPNRCAIYNKYTIVC